jgi:hypothetical protein
MLLLASMVVLAYGLSVYNSADSSLSRLATGAPGEKTTWLFIGGAVLAVLGLVGILGGSKST